MYYSSILYLFCTCTQGVTYALFATSLAAAQGSLVGLTGVKALQWEKLCNIYTKFCVQAAIGVVIGALGSIVMAVVSSLSAYHLFRLYPTDPRPFGRSSF